MARNLSKPFFMTRSKSLVTVKEKKQRDVEIIGVYIKCEILILQSLVCSRGLKILREGRKKR